MKGLTWSIFSAFNYLNDSGFGLDVHEPSKFSTEELLSEAFLMNQSENEIHETDKGLKIESTYRIFVDMAENFTVKFSWKNEVGEILAPPSLQNESTGCHIGIKLGHNIKYQNSDFTAVQNDLLRLSLLLKCIQDEKNVNGVKPESDTVQKLIIKGKP